MDNSKWNAELNIADRTMNDVMQMRLEVLQERLRIAVEALKTIAIGMEDLYYFERLEKIIEIAKDALERIA